jgi:hypothetical protein
MRPSSLRSKPFGWIRPPLFLPDIHERPHGGARGVDREHRVRPPVEHIVGAVGPLLKADRLVEAAGDVGRQAPDGAQQLDAERLTRTIASTVQHTGQRREGSRVLIAGIPARQRSG